jgi:hypothetical protein
MIRVVLNLAGIDSSFCWKLLLHYTLLSSHGALVVRVGIPSRLLN